jgi:hypothetical protein
MGPYSLSETFTTRQRSFGLPTPVSANAAWSHRNDCNLNVFLGRFPEWEFGLPFMRNDGAQTDKASPSDYEKFSPDAHVGNWHTPTLVIHGGKDYR